MAELSQARQLCFGSVTTVVCEGNGMPDPVSIEGPVELIDGKLILRIPLEVGGKEFHTKRR